MGARPLELGKTKEQKKTRLAQELGKPGAVPKYRVSLRLNRDFIRTWPILTAPCRDARFVEVAKKSLDDWIAVAGYFLEGLLIQDSQTASSILDQLFAL